ncbi:hypothetical protein N9O61_06160 [Octadecabacter sp.]|nr:hypothetical protein [Octadecabacter sp.]
MTNLSVYTTSEGVNGDSILNVQGSFDGGDLYDIAVAEILGSNDAAIEDYFLAFDWNYTGIGEREILTEFDVSVDDVPYNLQGDDTIEFGGNSDDFFSGDGNDTVSGGAGADYLDGGDGKDVLSGGGGHDDLFGGKGKDELFGGKGADFLYGGKGNDKLYGGKFGDTMNGQKGDDKLFGGKGGDVLFGAKGDDTIKGGSGSDLFIFDAQAGSDKFKDFDVSQDVLVFVDEIDQDDVGEDFTVVAFGDIGIEFTDAQAVVDEYASVTANGVVFDFEQGSTILLLGVNTLDGLENAIEFITDIPDL